MKAEPAISDKARQAMDAALRILGSGDRTEREVCRLLKRKGFSSNNIDAVLEKLRSWNYVDDGRVALLWAKDKLERFHWGPARLSHGLLQRGVDPLLVEKTLEEVLKGRDEETLASAAVGRYLRTHPRPGDQRGLRRLAGFLGRRGYSTEVVARILQEIWAPDDAGAL